MRGVLLIFVADVLQDVAVGQQMHGVLNGERFGVGFGIVDGFLNLQAPEIHAARGSRPCRGVHEIHAARAAGCRVVRPCPAYE